MAQSLAARANYDMPPPNKGLHQGGKLPWLCLPAENGKIPRRVFSDPGFDPWLEAEIFEELLDDDGQVLKAAQAVNAARNDRTECEALVVLQRAIQKVFDEKYLKIVITRFDEALPLVALYMRAKIAARSR